MTEGENLQLQSDEKYFKKIDYVLFNEAEIRKLVNEEKLRIIRHEISNSSNLADPTAAQVLKDSTPVGVILLKRIKCCCGIPNIGLKLWI